MPSIWIPGRRTGNAHAFRKMEQDVTPVPSMSEKQRERYLETVAKRWKPRKDADKWRAHKPGGHVGLEERDRGSWTEADTLPVGYCRACDTLREAATAEPTVFSGRPDRALACGVCGEGLADRVPPPPACGPKQRGAFGSWPGDPVTREPYRGPERRYHQRRATA